MGVTADVRRAVQMVDPNLPIYQVRSIAEVVQQNSWFFQVFGFIFIIFGVSALLMASVGLYGVLAFSVSRRVNEMGIRMALGAGAAQVRKLILRQGATQISIGLALGLALAWGVSAMVQIIMFEVEPRDPTVFGGVVLMIALLSTSYLLSFAGFLLMLVSLLYFEHNARRLGRAGLEHVTQTMRGEGLRDVVGGAGEKMRERFKRDRSED